MTKEEYAVNESAGIHDDCLRPLTGSRIAAVRHRLAKLDAVLASRAVEIVAVVVPLR